MLGDRVEERHGLQTIARGARARLFDDATACDRVLDGRHDELEALLLHDAIAERDHLGKVVARVDVEEREGDAAGRERLLGDAQERDRILATGEEEDRTLALGHHFSNDEDRLVLQFHGQLSSILTIRSLW